MSGFKLGSVEVVVFDEADRMFEMGFAEQVRTLQAAAGTHLVYLGSATQGEEGGTTHLRIGHHIHGAAPSSTKDAWRWFLGHGC